MQTWHVQVRRISVRGILMVIAAAAHCKPLESHLVGVTLYDSTSLSYPIKTLSWYTLSITVQALLQDRIAQPGSVSISQSDTLRPLAATSSHLEGACKWRLHHACFLEHLSLRQACCFDAFTANIRSVRQAGQCCL